MIWQLTALLCRCSKCSQTGCTPPTLGAMSSWVCSLTRRPRASGELHPSSCGPHLCHHAPGPCCVCCACGIVGLQAMAVARQSSANYLQPALRRQCKLPMPVDRQVASHDGETWVWRAQSCSAAAGATKCYWLQRCMQLQHMMSCTWRLACMNYQVHRMSEAHDRIWDPQVTACFQCTVRRPRAAAISALGFRIRGL